MAAASQPEQTPSREELRRRHRTDVQRERRRRQRESTDPKDVARRKKELANKRRKRLAALAAQTPEQRAVRLEEQRIRYRARQEERLHEQGHQRLTEELNECQAKHATVAAGSPSQLSGGSRKHGQGFSEDRNLGVAIGTCAVCGSSITSLPVPGVSVQTEAKHEAIQTAALMCARGTQTRNW
ncbi:uncharacterized protein LOC144128246 isoform X2 [Amblyomma americanum]